MAKLEKVAGKVTHDDVMNSIASATVWMVVTLTENKDGGLVEVRESHPNVTIDTIAMLLDQKEIFDAVQKKIAQVKMKGGKEAKKSTNTDIN